MDRRVSSLVRVVVLGMPCDFTRAMLGALLRGGEGVAGLELAAVILAIPGAKTDVEMGTPAGLPMVPERTPIWGVGSRSMLADGAWLTQLRALAPDAIVAGCFPWRLPGAVLAMPRFGCLNIHPSLLPDGRGPEPVFWAFRWGLEETGVTVHRMDRDLDTGPIHAQAKVPVGDDATVLSLEAELAAIGGTLAREVIDDLVQATGTPTAQADGPTPWARFPGPDDVSVSTDQSAVAAARFIRAVAPVFGRVGCLVMATGQRIETRFGLQDLVGIREDGNQAEPVVRRDDTISVRFTPGTLRFRMAPDRAPLTLHPRRLATT